MNMTPDNFPSSPRSGAPASEHLSWIRLSSSLPVVGLEPVGTQYMPPLGLPYAFPFHELPRVAAKVSERISGTAPAVSARAGSANTRHGYLAEEATRTAGLAARTKCLI